MARFQRSMMSPVQSGLLGVGVCARGRSVRVGRGGDEQNMGVSAATRLGGVLLLKPIQQLLTGATRAVLAAS